MHMMNNNTNFNQSPAENIINGGTNGLIQWATNEELNPGRIDLHYEPHEYNRELLRYKTGKIDIIIPYYNETEN